MSPGKPVVQLSSRQQGPKDEDSVTDEINLTWAVPTVRLARDMFSRLGSHWLNLSQLGSSRLIVAIRSIHADFCVAQLHTLQRQAQIGSGKGIRFLIRSDSLYWKVYLSCLVMFFESMVEILSALQNIKLELDSI